MIELLRGHVCGTNRCVKIEWVLGLLALLGFFAVLMVTSWGCGLAPDSIVYLDTAANLLRGNGWSYAATDGVLRPMTQYPPLFPSVVALIGLAGLDVPQAARCFNAVLFAALIFLVGFALSRYTRGAFWPSVLPSFFVLTCVPLIRIYSSALSEASFIFFGLLGMVLLSIYFKEKSHAWLIAAALGVALSCLARYIGVAFVAGGALGLLLLSRKKIAGRIADAVIWGIVSCAPIALWVLRNLSLSGHVSRYATHVDIAATSKIRQHLDLAVRDVFAWGLPAQVPVAIRFAAFIVLVGFLAVISTALLRTRQSHTDGSLTTAHLGALPYILICFSISYCGFVFATIVLVQQGSFTARFMSVLYVVGFMLLACWFFRLSNLLRGAPLWRVALLAMVCGLAILQTGYSAIWVMRRHSEGLGYSTRNWQESAIVRTLRDLPRGTLILTNDSIPIYYHTGHPTRQLHAEQDPPDLADDSWPIRVRSIAERLQQDSVVLACFESKECTEMAELIDTILPLQVLAQEEDSAVYSAAH